MRSQKSTSILERLAIGNLILFFALTLIAGGQERKSGQPQDTSMNRLQIFQSRFMFVRLSSLHPQSLGFLYQPATVSSQPVFWTLQEKHDLASPWQLELENQEAYRTMRAILGAIELGGVAYIGYRHIKKYGLK